jgi:hypothetical protein
MIMAAAWSQYQASGPRLESGNAGQSRPSRVEHRIPDAGHEETVDRAPQTGHSRYDSTRWQPIMERNSSQPAQPKA